MTYTAILEDGTIVRLTTDHPASSYGMGVIVVDGNPYGPADQIPVYPEMPGFFSMTGAAAAERICNEAACDECDRLARRYLSQQP